jgi:hypothetical protein
VSSTYVGRGTCSNSLRLYFSTQLPARFVFDPVTGKFLFGIRFKPVYGSLGCTLIFSTGILFRKVKGDEPGVGFATLFDGHRASPADGVDTILPARAFKGTGREYRIPNCERNSPTSEILRVNCG